MKLISILIIILSTSIITFSQDLKKLEITGYVSELTSAMKIDTLDWINDRLNVFYYPSDNLRFSVQARTRLMSGETIESMSFQNTINNFNHDNGWIDGTENLFSDKSTVLNGIL